MYYFSYLTFVFRFVFLVYVQLPVLYIAFGNMKSLCLYLTFHLSISQRKYFVTKCWIQLVPPQMLHAVLSQCIKTLEKKINVILNKWNITLINDAFTDKPFLRKIYLFCKGHPRYSDMERTQNAINLQQIQDISSG